MTAPNPPMSLSVEQIKAILARYEDSPANGPAIHYDVQTIRKLCDMALRASGEGQRKAVSSRDDYRTVECNWSPETPDACPYCSGEACAQCVGTKHCEHDSFERHVIADKAPAAEGPSPKKQLDNVLDALQRSAIRDDFVVQRSDLERWLEALQWEQGGEPIGTYTADAIAQIKATLADPNQRELHSRTVNSTVTGKMTFDQWMDENHINKDWRTHTDEMVRAVVRHLRECWDAASESSRVRAVTGEMPEELLTDDEVEHFLGKWRDSVPQEDIYDQIAKCVAAKFSTLAARLVAENKRICETHIGLMAEADRRLEQSSRREREWVWVPREPTKEIMDAMDKADRDFSNNNFHGKGHMSRVEFIYDALLIAASKEKPA